DVGPRQSLAWRTREQPGPRRRNDQARDEVAVLARAERPGRAHGPGNRRLVRGVGALPAAVHADEGGRAVGAGRGVDEQVVVQASLLPAHLRVVFRGERSGDFADEVRTLGPRARRGTKQSSEDEHGLAVMRGYSFHRALLSLMVSEDPQAKG